mmetsp:Transcript_126516/g.357824  ORF Transcript_126516/g.357824 Transcript_126516/m.357824 type:complete len:206 (-) Transcript_126516:410-1027(-)
MFRISTIIITAVIETGVQCGKPENCPLHPTPPVQPSLRGLDVTKNVRGTVRANSYGCGTAAVPAFVAAAAELEASCVRVQPSSYGVRGGGARPPRTYASSWLGSFLVRYRRQDPRRFGHDERARCHAWHWTCRCSQESILSSCRVVSWRKLPGRPLSLLELRNSIRSAASWPMLSGRPPSSLLWRTNSRSAVSWPMFSGSVRKRL